MTPEISPDARVLVVDDEPANRRLLTDLMRREGFEVLVANSGAEALAIIERDSPDVVLLDLMMPEVDGMAVLHELQGRGLLPALPVVVVTAHEDRQARLDALTAGAVDFLVKPIDRLEVLCRVRTLVELRLLKKRAVATAKDAVLSELRNAVGVLPLVLYRKPSGPGAAESSGWVIGDIDKLIGLSPAEFLSTEPWLELMDHEDREAFRFDAAEALDRLLDGVSRPVRIVRPDGETRWIMSCVTLGDDGETEAGALFDVTEEKRLERELVQAQKMEAFGQLAGGVAHDFNNILSAILTFGEFLREATPEEDARRADIAEILHAADRAVSLTRQLLTFARQQPVDVRPTDICESVKGLMTFLKRTLGENILLETKTPSHPMVVRIDPVQFDQIVLNLAVNARDAMPNGGMLTFEIAHPVAAGGVPDLARASLFVRDTGTGMSDATRRRIFEPFFTTKSKGKGTGLGLATCFGIVQSAGGAIRVETTEGQGTVFIVDLPIFVGSSFATELSRSPAARDGRGERVLVVEDEAALRRAVVRLLERAGYEVHVAHDGLDAIRKLDALGDDVALVLTDVVMPGCSGYEVALHASAAAPSAAILLISGYLDGDPPANAPDYTVLSKPVSHRELARAVAAAIAHRKAALSSRLDRGGDPIAP